MAATGLCSANGKYSSQSCKALAVILLPLHVLRLKRKGEGFHFQCAVGVKSLIFKQRSIPAAALGSDASLG